MRIFSSAEPAFIGNNIYNTDGTGQTKMQAVPNDTEAIYDLEVQNDGNVADRFKVKSQANAAGWSVQYLDRDTNIDITNEVTGAGWTTRLLPPQGYTQIRLRVKPNSTATGWQT